MKFIIIIAAAGAGLLGLGAFLGYSWLWPSASNVIAGEARIVDGDTVEIREVRIRLEGIDAPESDQQCQDVNGRSYWCGSEATAALEKLAAGSITCEQVGFDQRNKRPVSICRNADGLDLNAELVRQGLAVAFRRYSMRYAAIEDEARAARRGLWAGTFELPGCFRAAREGRECRDVMPGS